MTDAPSSVPDGPPPRRSRGTHRGWLAATALAVTAALVLGGCSANQPDPAREAEPTVTPGSSGSSPVATPALDECSLLRADELTPPDAARPYVISSRTAAPDHLGNGWEVSCGYGPAAKGFGRADAMVTVTSGASVKLFSERARPSEPPEEGLGDATTPSPTPDDTDPNAPTEVSGLGEEAWVSIGSPDDAVADEVTPVDSADTSRIQILSGTAILTIVVPRGDDPDADRERLTSLGRKALPRLPKTFTVPPIRLDGACARINRALAVRATEIELPGARSVIDDRVAVCEFSGTTGAVTVIADGTPGGRARFDERRQSARHSVDGVGAEAFSTTEDPVDDLWIRTSGRILRISRHQTSLATPTPELEQTALQGDRLAFAQQVASASDG